MQSYCMYDNTFCSSIQYIQSYYRIGRFHYNALHWVIDLPIVSSGGGGNTRKHRYYCPKGRVLRNDSRKNYLVDAMDV